jgi:signal-transduction protein with cAMP-binding, CBS, and nucleotidyltransferase domain
MALMTQVRDVMAGPVVAVGPDDSAADAARLMRVHDTGDVVVLDDGRLSGILTDRDLALRLVAEGIDPFVACSEICSRDPVTVAPEDPIDRVAELMSQHAIRRLPVCEGSQVVGFVSLGDIAGHSDVDGTLFDISSAPPSP